MKASDCTLRVIHNGSGEEWLTPISTRQLIDLKTRIQNFLRTELNGEVRLDGELSRLDGEYTATIYTNGRQPGGGVCWASAGFYVKSTY